MTSYNTPPGAMLQPAYRTFLQGVHVLTQAVWLSNTADTTSLRASGDELLQFVSYFRFRPIITAFIRISAFPPSPAPSFMYLFMYRAYYCLSQDAASAASSKFGQIVNFVSPLLLTNVRSTV
jgi:hypothetical protein